MFVFWECDKYWWSPGTHPPPSHCSWGPWKKGVLLPCCVCFANQGSTLRNSPPGSSQIRHRHTNTKTQRLAATQTRTCTCTRTRTRTHPRSRARTRARARARTHTHTHTTHTHTHTYTRLISPQSRRAGAGTRPHRAAGPPSPQSASHGKP